MSFTLALDVGQASDWSALAVLDKPAGPSPGRYHLAHLERVRGLPYVGTPAAPGLVEKVRDFVLGAPSLHGAHLGLDRTGVGRAVGDAFRVAGLPCCLWAVTVTAGQSVRQEGLDLWVPKHDLVTTAQTLLSSGRLLLDARLPLAEVLRMELKNFRVKITEAGHESYGAWRENEHDDLVFAVALACWLGERFPDFTRASLGRGGPRPVTRLPRGESQGADFRSFPRGT